MVFLARISTLNYNFTRTNVLIRMMRWKKWIRHRKRCSTYPIQCKYNVPRVFQLDARTSSSVFHSFGKRAEIWKQKTLYEENGFVQPSRVRGQGKRILGAEKILTSLRQKDQVFWDQIDNSIKDWCRGTEDYL